MTPDADLSEFSGRLSETEIRAVAAQYELDLSGPTEPGRGTASPKVIVGTPPGRHLVRRRRREFSDPDVVAFDHSVIDHLTATGLPVVPPERTQTRQTAVWHEGRAYEVFRYVEGLSHIDPRDGAQRVQAAGLLARLHDATSDFTPAGCKDWQRELHMATNRRTLQDTLSQLSPAADEAASLAERMLAEARTVEAHLPDDRVAALPTVIVHGDFTWGNLMFRNGELAGVFDFDWTYRQTPLDDLARAILYIAFRRPWPLRDDSIWDLLVAWEPDLERAALFLGTYEARRPLTSEERGLLPWFVRETWLSHRVRGMRKVPDGEKLELLTRGMGPILDRWQGMGEEEVVGLSGC